MINRSAILVRPQQPYLDWASSLDDEDLLDASETEQTVYLVPPFEDEEQADEVLAECWEPIFDNELFGWHTNEADWPQDRTLEMFFDWFEVEIDSVVLDLVDAPILSDGG